jgi:hypothetical protein
MKAVLEAWGAESNLFHQGVAKESKDPEVVAATMAKPDLILRRPVGSNGPFNQQAALPTYLSNDEVNGRPKRPRAKPKKPPPRKTDDEAARQAALEYAGKKRPRGRRSGNVASRRSPRRRQHSKRPSGSMTPGQAPLRPSAPPWKNTRKPRTPVGRSRNRSWTSLRRARE